MGFKSFFKIKGISAELLISLMIFLSLFNLICIVIFTEIILLFKSKLH